MGNRSMFVGLDVHKDTIDVSIAEGDRRRLERLTEQLGQLAPAWRWAPEVAALQALSGVSFLTASGSSQSSATCDGFITHAN